MMASMITLTTPIEIAAQRASDLTIASSGMATRSAHHAAGQEHEEVNQQPPQEQQAGAERGERKGAARNLPHDALQILVGRTGRHGFLPGLRNAGEFTFPPAGRAIGPWAYVSVERLDLHD